MKLRGRSSPVAAVALTRGGKLVKLGVAALFLGCIAWPATAAASSQGADHTRAVSANSQTFTDPTGDSGNAPDVTTVVVSNDDNGQVTFVITLANRPVLTDQDFLSIFADTNGNPSDGAAGADFLIGISNTGAALFSAVGGTLTPVSAASFSGSFANGVQTVSVNKADIGNPTQINFQILSSGDNVTSVPEFAPDGGTWSYQVAIATPVGPTGSTGPPPVRLAAAKPQLSKAVAGKPFTVSTVVTNNGEGVKGTVGCAAKLGGKPLTGARAMSTAAGKATCSWRLPGNAHGKPLSGTIKETYQGKAISRSFSTRVR